MSLVELMVGVAVGLIVVAAAATVTATQLADSRRLVLEAQVQQDLRATADIITREVRRAGHWTDAATAVAVPGLTQNTNPFDAITVGSGSVSVSRSSNSPVVFSLSGAPNGVITLQRGSGSAQALTDVRAVVITGFTPTLRPVDTLTLTCAAECPTPTFATPQACWPTLEVRELEISITGRAASDSAVERSIRTAVRLRSDRVVNNNGGGPLCPPVTP